MKPLYVKKNGTVNKVSGVAMPNTFPANRVGYDNTESELEATNTQDAIDEVVDIVADKVDKVTGKGLSTNDYDNTDKAKVGKIDETTTSVTGNPISISGLKSNQLAKDPVITLEPIQAGSGDPSPSNVRAISGYDKIEVLSGTKNLCGDLIDNTVIVYNTGEATYNANYMCTDFIPIKANTYYTITNASPGAENWVYHTDKTPWVKINNGAGTSIRHFYTDDDGYIRCSYQKSDASENKYLQIEVGQESTAYVPYNPQIKLQLGQTIYGGTLDVEKGILTVDRGYVDLGTLEWTYENWNGNYYFAAVLAKPIKNSSNDEAFNGICSIYKIISFNDAYINLLDKTISYYYQDNALIVLNNSYSDATTFKTAMNGVQLVYELETPYIIQLTPHEISLLKDYAYVSTNGTNMQFSYKNGEMASLGDVENLGKTMNLLGDMFVYKEFTCNVDENGIATIPLSLDYILVSAVNTDLYWIDSIKGDTSNNLWHLRITTYQGTNITNQPTINVKCLFYKIK